MKKIINSIAFCLIILGSQRGITQESFNLNSSCFGPSQNQYQFIDKKIQSSNLDNFLGVAKDAKLVLHNTPLGVYEVDLTEKLNEFDFPSEEQFLASRRYADESTQKRFPDYKSFKKYLLKQKLAELVLGNILQTNLPQSNEIIAYLGSNRFYEYQDAAKKKLKSMFGLKDEVTEPALSYALKAMGAFDNGPIEIQLTQEQMDHLKYEIDGRLFHYFDGKIKIEKPAENESITEILAGELRKVLDDQARFDLLRFSYNRSKRKMNGRVHAWVPNETIYKKILNQFFYFEENDTHWIGGKKLRIADLRIYRAGSSDEREKIIYKRQNDNPELQYKGPAVKGSLYYLTSDQLSDGIITDINENGLSISESVRKRGLLIKKVVPYIIQKGDREERILIFADNIKAIAFKRGVIFVKQSVHENYVGPYGYEHPRTREYMRKETSKIRQNFHLKKALGYIWSQHRPELTGDLCISGTCVSHIDPRDLIQQLFDFPYSQTSSCQIHNCSDVLLPVFNSLFSGIEENVWRRQLDEKLTHAGYDCTLKSQNSLSCHLDLRKD